VGNRIKLVDNKTIHGESSMETVQVWNTYIGVGNRIKLVDNKTIHGESSMAAGTASFVPGYEETCVSQNVFHKNKGVSFPVSSNIL
jgi:hypothetical protein